MQVELAKYAGFCFGVKRAVDTVYEKLAEGKKIYTFGPIVHNEEVVKDLEEKGVKVIEETDLPSFHPEPDSVIIIRAHGVPKSIYEDLTKSGAELVDATCPFVKKIHRIVEEKSAAGEKILIAGSADHPEVKGIMGWCKGACQVLETPLDAEKFSPNPDEKITLVSQTTYQYNKFQYIVDIFANKGYNVSVVNTICSATEERQHSAEELSKRADVMIVIGGKHSSNTRKLYEICSKACEQTYYIQTLDDLYLELPESVGLVGITAGASTPQNIIEEVQKYVRTYF